MTKLPSYDEAKVYKGGRTECTPFELARLQVGDQPARLVVVGKRGLVGMVDEPVAVVEVLSGADRLGGERWTESNVPDATASMIAALLMRERAAQRTWVERASWLLCGASTDNAGQVMTAVEQTVAALAAVVGAPAASGLRELVAEVVTLTHGLARPLGCASRLRTVADVVGSLQAIARRHGEGYIAQDYERHLLAEGDTLPEALRRLAGYESGAIAQGLDQIVERLGLDGIGSLRVYYRDHELDVWPRNGAWRAGVGEAADRTLGEGADPFAAMDAAIAAYDAGGA